MEDLINRAFKREVIRKVTDVIVPLNDIGSGPAFYCVHSIGGGVTEFQYLVRRLGPDQQFYGIQAPTNRRNAELGRSIKAMSRHYVSELVKFQPDGAFILGGYSVGATIALEMAQQLIAMGRDVSLLVVLDGELFNTGAELSEWNPLYWLKLLYNVPRWLVDKHRLIDGSIDWLVNRRNFPPDQAAFATALADSCRDYVPDHYPGRVLLFVAKTQPLLWLRQVKTCWTKIAPSSELVEVSGTHLDIIKPPRVTLIAERLRQTMSATV
jgi:thioesterase domain-containing protein